MLVSQILLLPLYKFPTDVFGSYDASTNVSQAINLCLRVLCSTLPRCMAPRAKRARAPQPPRTKPVLLQGPVGPYTASALTPAAAPYPTPDTSSSARAPRVSRELPPHASWPNPQTPSSALHAAPCLDHRPARCGRAVGPPWGGTNAGDNWRFFFGRAKMAACRSQSAPHMHVLVCICGNVRQFH